VIFIVLCQVSKYRSSDLIDKFESFFTCHIAVLIVESALRCIPKQIGNIVRSLRPTSTTLLYFGQQHYKSTMLHQTTGLIVEDMLYYGTPNPSY
jgi:hypothetical protein